MFMTLEGKISSSFISCAFLFSSFLLRQIQMDFSRFYVSLTHSLIRLYFLFHSFLLSWWFAGLQQKIWQNNHKICNVNKHFSVLREMMLKGSSMKFLVDKTNQIWTILLKIPISFMILFFLIFFKMIFLILKPVLDQSKLLFFFGVHLIWIASV